jgi:peptide/nickel transport system ATP-binding protein
MHADSLMTPAPVGALPQEPLLSVRGLRTRFDVRGASFYPVDRISFDVAPGRTLAIVGESGCGKSATAYSLMRLLPRCVGHIVEGSCLFEGRDLVGLTDSEMRSVRGREIAMVFQEPMTSLNPVQTIGQQICEALRLHLALSAKDAWAEAIAGLRRVGIPAPEQRASQYPHQLSGGMRQRVVIAIALACAPKLIIADEPTTALDVTVQAQVLELFKAMQAESGVSLIMITHDLGVVAEVADEVAVMYAGRIVERAPVRELFENPQHPYTIGLLSSIPDFAEVGRRFSSIPGRVPSLFDLPLGCRFADRCPYVVERCRNEDPPVAALSESHVSACWRSPLP